MTKLEKVFAGYPSVKYLYGAELKAMGKYLQRVGLEPYGPVLGQETCDLSVEIRGAGYKNLRCYVWLYDTANAFIDVADRSSPRCLALAIAYAGLPLEADPLGYLMGEGVQYRAVVEVREVRMRKLKEEALCR